jgi:hypothetical protein
MNRLDAVPWVLLPVRKARFDTWIRSRGLLEIMTQNWVNQEKFFNLRNDDK